MIALDAILDNAARAVTLASNHLAPDDLLEGIGPLRRELYRIRCGGEVDVSYLFGLADLLQAKVKPEGQQHVVALRRAIIELTVVEGPTCAKP